MPAKPLWAIYLVDTHGSSFLLSFGRFGRTSRCATVLGGFALRVSVLGVIAMRKRPVCPLCSSRLERHEEVVIEVAASDGLTFSLAWVCTDCSAAFPIAVGKGGLIRKARPLYQDSETTG
jgi:hypothetical protein